MDASFQAETEVARKRERERVKARRRQGIMRSAYDAKLAAGLTGLRGFDKISDEELEQRRWSGTDTRSLTGMVLGDPIPGDPRCPWRPSYPREAR